METEERIKKFIALVDRIKSSRFVRETENIGLNLNFEVGKGGSQTIKGIDEEDMRSMLIDLRKLTLEKDEVYLPDILDLLATETSVKETQENIYKWKQAYEAFLAGPPTLPLRVNGKTDSVYEVLEKWFYGYYFHEHDKHQVFLKSLNFGEPIHKYNFAISISALIKTVRAISSIASQVLEENVQQCE
jgi:hypothetical protein